MTGPPESVCARYRHDGVAARPSGGVDMVIPAILVLVAPILLGLFTLAAWPWRWPVAGAPVWMPMLCLVASAGLLALVEPWEMVLVLVVYPVLLAVFVLAVRLARPAPGDPQIANLKRRLTRG